MRTVFSIFTILALGLGLGYAGTMSVAWDPVADADVAGYKVYYGTAPGVYPNYKDAGNTTGTTLTGLDPCTRYYVAVKAYDTGGLESVNYSNEVNGLPRPVVNTITPATGEQGATLTVTITGESFDTGATVEFSGTGITVQSVTRDSCTQVRATILIALTATTGARDVTVVNPDNSYGTKTGAFTVTANAAPTVSSTSPADGATDVAINIKPTVTFNEPMDPASITSSTVRLYTGGNPVAQAAGSPTLSGDGRTATITPAANLNHETVYKINVVGGAGGVKDSLGKAMASNYTQPNGFTTDGAPDTTPPTVSSTNPADGATNVPVTVKPSVTFSEAMDTASITSSTVQLLDSGGNPVAQAAGSPALSADKKTATITPALNLGEVRTYRIRVIGGSSGAKDEAGNALASTFTQNTGFQTENLPPGAVQNNRRTDVK